LENLRFDPGEEGNDPAFVARLVDGIDAYVDDAFGAAHRAHASIVGPPQTLPSAAGLLLQRDGHWLGLGTVSGVHDVTALQALGADSDGSVRLLDLKAASESLVVDYRTRILQALFAASLLLVLTITLALRSVRRAWHVLAPMTLATFLVLAVERVIGIEISLFHLVALILAGGLGLHYALFFERDTGDPAEQRRTLHATIVCVLSALLVFGMLAWATIPVLRAIGLTVSLGVAFHFCLSILMAPHVVED
ncbi:MAG: phosphoglycerate kinase, partial [Rhodanobacter sp.]